MPEPIHDLRDVVLSFPLLFSVLVFPQFPEDFFICHNAVMTFHQAGQELPRHSGQFAGSVQVDQLTGIEKDIAGFGDVVPVSLVDSN